jgi:hypothetical protein
MKNRNPLGRLRGSGARGRRRTVRLELQALEERTMLAASLVAAYSFSEGSGTTVADSSGNGNTGTIGNATWVSTGKYDNALQFTGATNSMVTVPNSSSLALSGGMTLEAWVDPSSLNSPDAGWCAAVSKDHPNSVNDVSYALYAAAGTATPPAAHILAGSNDVGVSGGSPLPLNTWTFLAATYDGATMKIYVNGTLAGSMAQTGAVTEVNAPLHIGGDWSGEMFTGLIDEVRVYNGALTQSQIQSDMNTPIASLTLGPSTLPGDTINVPYNQTITTTGGTGTVNLVVSNVQNAVAGLSVPGSGANALAITGTPTATGTETFTVTAADQAGKTTTANYSVTVNPAITLSPTSLAPGTAQSVFKQTIRASGGTGTVTLVTSNVQNPVPGLNVPASDTTELNINGTPTAAGIETFTVTATDGVGATTTINYSITINPPVVVTPATLPVGTVNDPYGFTFAASGGSGTGYSFSETGALPSGMTLSSSGVLGGTPLQSGTFNITVTGTDSNDGSGSQAFTLTVNPAVVPAPATLASATLNAPYSVTFTASGGSGSDYTFAESGALPAGVTFTSAGLLGGTPTQSGSFAITVTATDSNGGTGSVTDTLIVGTGSPPTVSLTSPSANSQDAGTLILSATASAGAGVNNVQFSVDGSKVGSAVTTAPYQVTWDSTKVADGSHTIAATVTDNNGITATSSITVQIVNGGVFGSIINTPANPVTGTPVVPMNMVLLDNGNILLWDGGPACLGAISDFVWNVSANTFTNVNLENQQEVRDIFCSDQTVLANGDVLVAGGHDCTSTTYIGTNIANLFDPATNTWTFLPNMNDRRWYPNAMTLPDGRVLVTAGSATSTLDYNPIPEVYDPVANTWTLLTNANQTIPNYPFMFVLPNGNVLAAGSDEAKMGTYELDVGTQTWTTVDPTVLDAGSAVQYLPGEFMKAGSSYLSAPPDNGGGTPSAATTYVLNMNQANPAWQQTASMANPRTHLNLTILPDDTVLATGGSTDIGGVNPANAVYQAELWSPGTQTWTPMASEQVPRLYHSTALLLPDGRVVVAGGGHNYYNNIAYPNAEIYSPAYLFKGSRPTISQAPPGTLSYGQNFFVGTPNASDIASVALIRNGSVTHAFNTDQTYVPLTFTQTSGGLTVTAPANSDLAPPGYYMLFIVNKEGVPAIAPMVNLPTPGADTTPPSAPTNLAAGGGIGQVTLSWTASTDNVGVAQYNVYRSATPGFTPSPANLIGTSTTTSYTNHVAAGIYYYLVTAQDAAGNISQPSNQATGTATKSVIQVVQDAAQGFESSTATISLAFPSNVTAGDTLIITGTASRPRSTITISDSAGNTFVPVMGPVSDPAQDVTAYIWVATNAKGGPDTVTLTPDGGADALEIHVSEWSGISQVSPADQTAFATGNGSQISSGTVTTTQNGELIYGYTFPNQNASAGAGFTGLSLINGDLDEYQIQSTAGSVAATFTQQPDNWLALVATFKPAVQDTQPPTAPTNLTATTGNIGSVGLSWTASTDNVGVTRYNVYRSTMSGFTPSSANLIGTSTTTGYTDNVAAGTYFYLVTAQDAASNVSQPSNQATGTSAADTIPPTVSVTSPTGGSTVGGTVTVSANASDNVAVASVQFLLDGAKYGSPLTAAPYSLSWNSTTVANGTHTWAAVATDPSGNATTSATVSFTVNNVAPPGLVAAYSLDENTGTAVHDNSGGGNNGTLSNATWTAGKYGSALKFTGATNSYVTINSAASLNETTGLTVEAWVNPSTLNSPDNGWAAAVAKENRASAANDVSYALYAAGGTGTPPALHLNLTGKGDQGVQGTAVLPLNTWTFLAGTYDGTTMKLYVNGTLVASRTMAGSIATTTNPLRIGGDWSGEMFTGVIDNVRLYNRALVASEISTDMGVPVGAQPMLVQPPAAGQAVPAGAGPDVSTSLTYAQMQPVLQEAIALWRAAGVPTASLSALDHLTVVITPLPPSYLGLTYGSTILVSPNAAGYGWFTDPSLTGVTVPPGRVDLLTVLVHEVGHVLGYGDTTAEGVMEEFLTPGVRLLPDGLD